NAIIQNKLPSKLKDTGSFTIPCNISNVGFIRALCDLGTSTNLMPLFVFRKLGLGEVKPTRVYLQLANRSVTYPKGVIKDMLVKVDKFIFSIDFIILNMEKDREISFILGHPFLATGMTLIDLHEGKLTLRVGQEEVTFNILQSTNYSNTTDNCLGLTLLINVLEVIWMIVEINLKV
ncbi:hypothetical protein MANES_11G091452v8, partial [Manihot esculenta]